MTAVLQRAGLADPVFDAQAVFRAVMAAMARPGSLHALPLAAEAPAPLCPAAAAVALSLLDADCLLWLDPPLQEAAGAADWLRFHSGTRITTDRAAAGFALLSDPRGMPALDSFAQGSDEQPHRSATLILQLDSLGQGPELRLAGPGLAAPGRLAPAPLPADFPARLAANRRAFPRGVDLILTDGAHLAALPRTTEVQPCM